MLTLGNKIIAGSFKSGASWEVGDVGISAFGIDEALNKRRYLNGQVISQAQFVEFTAMLKSRVSVYPSLATTEVNWQAEVTNSALGQCGKFVIDDDAGTIRLPKVVNINGLQDLTGLGTIKAESLPNITGNSGLMEGGKSGGIDNISKDLFGNNIANANARFNESVDGSRELIWGTFNAAGLVATYQDDAPVQQEAVQYPYFIQVAEGVETSVDVSREIELNNPFSLLDYKYSEYELDNASWLLSNGQWNNGATYSAVYNLLLAIYNGTETKAGVSVKLSTETYADTDFVLNTGDTTFRLPTKVLMAGSKKVAGNGKQLGITNGTNSGGLVGIISSGYIASDVHYNADSYSGVSTTGGTATSLGGKIGITTDETKSGIETSANGLYLYFYVGETVQDANIIAAGQALTDIANLKNLSNISDNGTATGASWAMPSNTYETLTAGASGAEYIAPSNGYFYCQTRANANGNGFSIIKIDSNNNTIMQEMQKTLNASIIGGFLPVLKNEAVKIFYDSANNLLINFIYAVGSEWEKE